VDSHPPNHERRIGSRVDIEPVAVRWILPNQKKGLFRKPPERVGRMVNLSITGAGIETPDDVEVRAGTIVGLQVGPYDTQVRVRRSIPGVGPGLKLVGVEFVNLRGALKDEVVRALADGRPAEDDWLRAK